MFNSKISNDFGFKRKLVSRQDYEDIKEFCDSTPGVWFRDYDLNYCKQIGDYLYDVELTVSRHEIEKLGKDAFSDKLSEYLDDKKKSREREKAQKKELEELREKVRKLEAAAKSKKD